MNEAFSDEALFRFTPQYEASPFHSDMKHFAYAPYDLSSIALRATDDVRKWEMRVYPERKIKIPCHTSGIVADHQYHNGDKVDHLRKCVEHAVGTSVFSDIAIYCLRNGFRRLSASQGQSEKVHFFCIFIIDRRWNNSWQCKFSVIFPVSCIPN